MCVRYVLFNKYSNTQIQLYLRLTGSTSQSASGRLIHFSRAHWWLKWRKVIKEVRWPGWVWAGECFFWYRPTRVVPDKRPLNGCCCCCHWCAQQTQTTQRATCATIGCIYATHAMWPKIVRHLWDVQRRLFHPRRLLLDICSSLFTKLVAT